MNGAINAARNQRPEPLRYAGFWVRCVAQLVDTFVVLVFLCFVLALIMIYGIPSADSPVRGLFGILTVVAVIWGFCFWYFGALVASYKRGTWGQRLMGIQVVHVNGYPLGFWGALEREFAIDSRWILGSGFTLLNKSLDGASFSFSKILSMSLIIGPALAFIAIDAYMIVSSEKKQSLHDRIAGTYVIYKPKKPQLANFKYVGTGPRVAEAKRRLEKRGRLGP